MSEMFRLQLCGVALGVVLLLLALFVALMWYVHVGGFNVPRQGRRGGDVVWYDDMSADERRAAGFVPMDEQPSDWQDFYKGKLGDGDKK